MIQYLRRLCGRSLPGQWLGLVDHLRLPAWHDHLAGGFNGQCFRQQIFLELMQLIRFDALVETGSYRGATTRFMAINSGIPVVSCESNPRFAYFTARRLARLPNVTVYHQDSRHFLAQLTYPTTHMLFFYLDAHWYGDLPLREEVDIILARYPDSVIMIDDFEVPNDPDYRFDDYGPGKRLSLSDFPFHLDPRVRVFFPRCPSKLESRPKVGSVILAGTPQCARLSVISSLLIYNGVDHMRSVAALSTASGDEEVH